MQDPTTMFSRPMNCSRARFAQAIRTWAPGSHTDWVRKRAVCPRREMEINNDNEVKRKIYGMDEKITETVGRQCLLARRLVEHGVRFVQVFAGELGEQNTDTWDAHVHVKTNHSLRAAETDRPI